MSHSGVDQLEAGPLPGRLEEQDFTLLKFGGIFACHLNQRAILVGS
jgi:hypothetical protein